MHRRVSREPLHPAQVGLHLRIKDWFRRRLGRRRRTVSLGSGSRQRFRLVHERLTLVEQLLAHVEEPLALLEQAFLETNLWRLTREDPSHQR